jgi:hypothetical protein
MKAVATLALLGLAYAFDDNEFLVRPVHLPHKKISIEQHERVPEMSRPLPPPPKHLYDPTVHDHELMRTAYVPVVLVDDIQDSEAYYRPPTVWADDVQDSEAYYRPPTMWADDIQDSEAYYRLPTVWADDVQDNEAYYRLPTMWTDDEELFSTEKRESTKPYVTMKNNPNASFHVFDDSHEDSELTVAAKHQISAYEKYRKEALHAAKEMQENRKAIEDIINHGHNQIHHDDFEDDILSFRNVRNAYHQGVKLIHKLTKKHE